MQKFSLDVGVHPAQTKKASFKPCRFGDVYDTALISNTAGLKDWIADKRVARQAFTFLR